MSDLKKAQLTGEGPLTLKEKRGITQKKKEEEEAKKIRKEKAEITFKQFFQETYFPIAQSDKKRASWRREDSLFRLWINPIIGHVPIKDLAPEHIDPIKAKMIEAEKAPRTIQYAMAVIRQAWNTAKARNIVKGDTPTKYVKIPKFDNRRLRFLTQKEANTLLKKLKDQSKQLYEISLISLHCGLRASEIFGLKWSAIDLNSGTITIFDPKGKINRLAFMTSKVSEIIEALPHKNLSELVFKARGGGQIEQVSNAFDRAVEEIGLNDDILEPRQKVVFHTLRHTYASWMVQNGENLYTVKELLGHSTIQTTERYSHLDKINLKSAVQRFENNLKKEKSIKKNKT